MSLEKEVKLEGKEVSMITTMRIPGGFGISHMKEKTLTFPEVLNWDGHSFGSLVGIVYDDGRIVSYLKVDTDNTEAFDALVATGQLFEKPLNMLKNDKMIGATHYYIPYKIVGHSSAIPTVTSKYVDGCSNVEYDITFEVVFVGQEDLMKYLLVSYKTRGHHAATFFDQIESLEDAIEGMFEDKTNGFMQDKSDKILYADFYDNVGEKCPIELYSIKELMSMITSIRVVKLDTKIV